MMTEKELMIDDIITGKINSILESLSCLFYDATRYQRPQCQSTHDIITVVTG